MLVGITTLLLSCLEIKFKETSVCSVVQSHPTCDPMDRSPTRLLCPWDFPAKNAGVGCHFLLQGIFPTQGWNPGIKPTSPRSPAFTGGFFTTEPPGKPQQDKRECQIDKGWACDDSFMF